MRRIEGKIAVVTGGAQTILSKYITGAEMVVDGGMTVGLPY